MKFHEERQMELTEAQFHTFRAMEKTHHCSECKAPLILFWDGSANKYQLKCAHHRQHQGYERRPTMAQECQERERQMRERKPSLSGMTVDDLF